MIRKENARLNCQLSVSNLKASITVVFVLVKFKVRHPAPLLFSPQFNSVLFFFSQLSLLLKFSFAWAASVLQAALFVIWQQQW